MSQWSEIEFEYESETYGLLKVSLSVSSSGSYEEPMLEQDGDLLIEKVLSVGESPLVCVREKRIEQGAEIPGYPGQRYPDIHHMARYERNPKYHSHEIPLSDFPESERREIESLVERRLDETCAEYASEIGQDLAESAADAFYESIKDGGY